MTKKDTKIGKLTDKQERFCLEYVVDLNATQAAIRAGYSKKTAQRIGSENLSKPLIQERLGELVGKITEDLELSSEWVLGNLKELVERCMQKTPVMERRDGELVQATDETGAAIWQFDSSGANSALDKLGKYFKLFTDKVERSGDVSHTFVMKYHEPTE